MFRDRRIELGMTQGDVARAINFAQSYVNHVEQGRRAPSKDYIRATATALNMAVPS